MADELSGELWLPPLSGIHTVELKRRLAGLPRAGSSAEERDQVDAMFGRDRLDEGLEAW
ncbi:hypothetical protein ACIHAX_02565 [Nocardia sp. NPDC051929]|uniref:hypothetical protein n=1 Tax=Nocardia sp. NPDC051929 TaxID=3364327 RepID=UPI0037CB0853